MSRARSLPGFPERTLQVPAGCVLGNEEIIALLVAADERKRRGESWITAEDAGPEGFTVRVPKSAAITREESIIVLSRLNEAKEYGFSDLLITYADAVIAKCWLTVKSRGMTGDGRLTIQGPARSRQF